MSINHVVAQAIAAGKLVPFRDPLGWDGAGRTFLMCAGLISQMDAARAVTDVKQIARWERLNADIAHFVGNGYINWNLMKWLDPRRFEHWELRSVRPRPSIRVFGRFAAPDVFVATHAVERALLGAKWDVRWEIEKLVCEDEWHLALGDEPPFSADDYTRYITQNASKDVRLDP